MAGQWDLPMNNSMSNANPDRMDKMGDSEGMTYGSNLGSGSPFSLPRPQYKRNRQMEGGGMNPRMGQYGMGRPDYNQNMLRPQQAAQRAGSMGGYSGYPQYPGGMQAGGPRPMGMDLARSQVMGPPLQGQGLSSMVPVDGRSAAATAGRYGGNFGGPMSSMALYDPGRTAELHSMAGEYPPMSSSTQGPGSLGAQSSLRLPGMLSSLFGGPQGSAGGGK